MIEKKSDFKRYAEFYNAKKVKIGKKMLLLLDRNENVIRILYFSKSINFKITTKLLLQIDYQVGDLGLYIMENGHENKDWLYANEIATILTV